ncbi:hypothetical protein C5167_012689 [Papaver somniferum]|uniref:Uncharacterized protein n=1 Tax=Papaver somniferum TaxID=3469 RepID=A0A4Y7J2G9_PAPSO|nr:hypothetical protein C5167_012689 [Papaver somniferum]
MKLGLSEKGKALERPKEKHIPPEHAQRSSHLCG